MKRLANRTTQQLNLSLNDAPATVVPKDKQRDLAVALMELLINASRENEGREDGGGHEPEVNH
jgi:hypothetical protein